MTLIVVLMKKPKNEFFNPIKNYLKCINNVMKFFISQIFYITNFLDISTTLDFLDAINFNWIEIPDPNERIQTKVDLQVF